MWVAFSHLIFPSRACVSPYSHFFGLLEAETDGRFVVVVAHTAIHVCLIPYMQDNSVSAWIHRTHMRRTRWRVLPVFTV